MTRLPPDWELPRGYRARLLLSRARASLRREPRAMLAVAVVVLALALTWLAVTVSGGPQAACRRATVSQAAPRKYPACVPALPSFDGTP